MTDPINEEKPSVFTFPCAFPIKIVGLANAVFELNVLAIIKKHFPTLTEGSLKQRPSAEGKYLAFTVTVDAESQKQLDALYQELTKCPDVIMVL